MGRRTWIKIYSEKWLRGTLREETPATRGIWMDVLALAGDSFYGDDGTIKFSKNMGFTDEQISDLLCLSIKDWQITKTILIKTNRIKIDKNNIVSIKNWSKYQSEYERQKKYRLKNGEKPQELQTEVTAKVTERREKREERREKDKNIHCDSDQDVKPKAPTKQLFGVWQAVWLKHKDCKYSFIKGKDGMIASRLWANSLNECPDDPMGHYTAKARLVFGKVPDIGTYGCFESYWNSVTPKKKGKKYKLDKDESGRAVFVEDKEKK